MTEQTEAPAIQFNAEQLNAIAEAVHWFKGWHMKKHRKQAFFLAGFAGTGKTTVAQEIARQISAFLARSVEATVIFIAPTGKAASRLRQKGCKGARTMHQVIYNVRGEDEDGEPIFIGKGVLDEMPRLFILDEASMVGEHDNRQLLGHGVPVLALGDFGQVDPVRDAGVYVEGKEDVLLQTIERNAGNIVRASMFVRKGNRLPPREYDDVKVYKRYPKIDELVRHSGEDGQIICCYNNTREETNARVRKALGYSGPLPQVGEKVVCMFNQHGYNFMNGEQGIVIDYEEIPEEDRDEQGEDEGKMLIRLKSLTNGKEILVKFNPASFSEDEDIRKSAQKTPGGFDFGYALTTHKAQGSEWPYVLVIEEFLGNYAKIAYTQITRAITHLTFCLNPNR